jgi:hypothetical protein
MEANTSGNKQREMKHAEKVKEWGKRAGEILK